MKFVLTALIIYFSLYTSAQNNHEFLTFKEDSTQSFKNQLVQKGFITEISCSAEDIEIRQYTTNGSNEALVNILKCKDNSCYIEIYKCTQKRFINYKEYPDSIGKDKWGNIYQRKIIRHIYDSLFDGNIDTLLMKLNNCNFFAIKDQSNLLDSLKANSYNLKSPCKGVYDCFDGDTYYELKMGSAKRNFNLKSLDYYVLNKGVTEFEQNHYIQKSLHSLFRIHLTSYYEQEKKQFYEKGIRSKFYNQ